VFAGFSLGLSAGLLGAVVGLPLTLIPLFPRPTQAVARGCLLVGSGIFVLILSCLRYNLDIYGPVRLLIAAATGAIVVVVSLVARSLARRNAHAPERSASI
jgi:hypothetical protein